MLIAGVDEVGRGPLAGPVVTAAVILDANKPIAGLNDSKKLSAKKREALVPLIKANAIAWAYGRAEVAEIDQLNILQATMLAMQRAVAALPVRPDLVRVDGNRAPDFGIQAETLIGGDGLDAAIGAASILAKVARDHEMSELDSHYPGYGLAKHAGYPTAAHLAALEQLGPSLIHRRSFKPVARLLTPKAE